MINKKILTVPIGIVFLASCSSVQLSPVASKVQISRAAPAKNCKFVNTVTATQGNFFTGSFTSNNNLQEGAYNKVRNEAAEMGGNYIQLISSQAGNTGGGNSFDGNFDYSSQQTNYTVTGSVYNCPNN
ncbi:MULTISPECIES: DUF4156 domain-containing protein [unclassified Francisella]|uniref:DUF4156 domain-containing protein n=1 Tax=unclassified Francisella TaxID=2610885 RepID=UPI002E2FC811|nr:MULTISPECIES: DUF4156 domain-containing protein [unclassified Francisella]MED7818583.1 DUF4156 domain-containing protein [Francisella sp. 19S2-4]MED7829419.1 DUF4156 domain-containing protein [Francisella sp. 19S2-10]